MPWAAQSHHIWGGVSVAGGDMGAEAVWGVVRLGEESHTCGKASRHAKVGRMYLQHVDAGFEEGE